MRKRISTLVFLTAAAAACGGGSASPPALAFDLPTVTDLRYLVGDTLAVEINALGQSLNLDVQSVATFGVQLARGEGGLTVTMGVEDLAAELNAPIAGTTTVDESVISGELVFSLDRRGVASVISTPEVASVGGLFSATAIANTFFPRLPGRAVTAGDQWVDTVTFGDTSDFGDGSQTTVLEYTAVGDARVGDRALLEVTFVGTTATDQTMSLQGTEVRQVSELEVEGRVLWDVQRSLMVESETTSTGPGTVEVAGVPGRLPTNVEIRSRARLQE